MSIGFFATYVVAAHKKLFRRMVSATKQVGYLVRRNGAGLLVYADGVSASPSPYATISLALWRRRMALYYLHPRPPSGPRLSPRRSPRSASADRAARRAGSPFDTSRQGVQNLRR